MKHLIVVLSRAAADLLAAPPASWLGLGARGRRGRVLLAADPRWPADEGREVLSLLGYRAEQPCGDLSACDALGRGDDAPLPLALDPFTRRYQLRAGWMSESERTRGIARALGLAIFPAAGSAKELLGQSLELLAERDLLVVWVIEPPEGWAGRPLAAFDLDFLGGLSRVRATDLRVLALATAPPGSDSTYAMQGAGLTPLSGEQPRIDRGEELLPRFVQSFNV